MNRIVKRLLRGLGYGLLSLIGLVLIAVGWLYWYSNGTTAPIVDAQGNNVPGSIASLEPVMLNGTRQWVLIRGYDRTKPVLLILHGGPGSPEMPLLTNYKALEKRFVVVNWDQRGAGKSYDPAVFDASFTLETFVSDAVALSTWLTRRFQRPKLYLMGHSWGTLLGVKTVQQRPDLFYAYVGIGQVANQLAGEQVSYDWVREQARQRHDDDGMALLNQYGRPPYASVNTWLNYLIPQRDLVASYGGSIHVGSLNKMLMKGLVFSREYTLRDKLNYLVGAMKTLEKLWPVVVQTDLNQTAPRLLVPVFMMQGVHDYQTPYVIAKTYFDQLTAPQKQFFTFQHSAHGPMFEEPALFTRRLDEIRRRVEIRPVLN